MVVRKELLLRMLFLWQTKAVSKPPSPLKLLQVIHRASCYFLPAANRPALRKQVWLLAVLLLLLLRPLATHLHLQMLLVVLHVL